MSAWQSLLHQSGQGDAAMLSTPTSIQWLQHVLTSNAQDNVRGRLLQIMPPAADVHQRGVAQCW